MPAPKNRLELEKISDLSASRLNSVVFHLTDFLISNPIPRESLDCGMYRMPSHVGDTNFEEAFKDTLWALYEQLFEDKKPEAAGPWVHIGTDGIKISKERHIPFSIGSLR